MQLKMQDILNFVSFYDLTRSQKLSIKTAYRLARLAKVIEEEVQFYREKFQVILQEYGEKNENGQLVPTEDGSGVKLIQGMEEACFSAIHDLQELEVTLPDIKFNLEEFGDMELTTNDIGSILPFIEE
jgi:predicted transposase YdaD